MSQSVEFVFDFASPNAYLAYHALLPLLERTGATLELSPCLLGGIFKATGNQAPMMAFASIPAKLDYINVEIRRFIDRHGLSAFRFNPNFPVNTLLLMRGAIAAQREDQLQAFLDIGWSAMWEESLKMDDPDVFVAAVSDAGLDGQALLAATQDPEVKAALVANTESAVQRGAFGIPTFFVGDEMFFGKDSLIDLEHMLTHAE